MDGGMYKGTLTVAILVIVMTIFSLFFVEYKSAPFYLCIFTLVIDVPFTIYLSFKIHKDSTKPLEDLGLDKNDSEEKARSWDKIITGQNKNNTIVNSEDPEKLENKDLKQKDNDK